MMITKSKINIYLKHKGFFEGYDRKYFNKNKPISDEEWMLIDELMTESYMMMNELSSKEFNDILNKKLLSFCDSYATINYIKESSKKGFDN